MNSKIVLGIVIGLIVGLVLGVFIGYIFISPSSKTVANANDQVTVSGTVTAGYGVTLNILYFQNLNGTFETSASDANGSYSVLLLGGQSYYVYDSQFSLNSGGSDYNVFYVPLGVSTFTENLVPNS